MDDTNWVTLENVVNGHHRVSYRGITAQRCPFDYVLYQMIITKIKPDLIVEIGTYEGGGALYMSDLLQLSGGGMVHTIDIKNRINNKLVLENENIKRFLNGYDGYDLDNTREFKKIMIVDDGSHTYKDVLAALKKFSGLVARGSYYIVEDGISEQFPLAMSGGAHCDGPLKAIREFLYGREDGDTWEEKHGCQSGLEIDRGLCDFWGENITFNVDGYLKKP